MFKKGELTGSTYPHNKRTKRHKVAVCFPLSFFIFIFLNSGCIIECFPLPTSSQSLFCFPIYTENALSNTKLFIYLTFKVTRKHSLLELSLRSKKLGSARLVYNLI